MRRGRGGGREGRGGGREGKEGGEEEVGGRGRGKGRGREREREHSICCREIPEDAALESHGISAAALLSIQVSSSGQCRVTFSEQSFAASICNHGINLKGSHIFPLAVDKSLNSIQIHIHDVPIWVSNAAVGAALSEYGTVIGAIRHGKVKVRDNLFVASGVRFAAFKLLPGRSIQSYIKTCDGKGT